MALAGKTLDWKYCLANFFFGLFHLMGPLATQILCHLGDDAPCTSLRTAFNAAMTTRFHFPPLVLLLFRCGGLCAALGIIEEQNMRFSHY